LEVSTTPRAKAEAASPTSAAAAASRRAPYHARTVALVVIALIVALFALRMAAAFFIPLVLSLFLSYALSPPVDWLARWHVPRPIGAALIMLMLTAIIATLADRASSDAAQLLEQLPQAVEQVRLALTRAQRDGQGPLQHVQRAASELDKLARSAEPAPAARPAPAQAPTIDVHSMLLIGTSSVIVALGQLVSVLFLTYFLLTAGDMFRRKLIDVIGPSLSRRRIAVTILEDINRLNQHYFAVILVVNIAVGIATGLAMQAIGLDRTTVWALAAAVLHTIPYLGAALLAGAAGLVAYFQLGTVNAALLAMALVLAIAGVLGIGLQTWLTGRAAHMNPPAVFVSLLFWGMLWGAWGLLLGVPIMVAVKTASDHVSALRWIGVLLGPDGTNYRAAPAP